MEHEYQVLTHIQENELTTQRKISKRTGLSLGAVNLLLNKMARKGLIKIEKLNARTMRYFLTPKGIQEKSLLTYRYIRDSYRQILRINQALDRLLADCKADLIGNRVVLCGPADEIQEILARHLNQNKVTFDLCCGYNETVDCTDNKQLVLVWREEDSRPGAVNIMNML